MKNAILLSALALLIGGATAVSWYRYMGKENYSTYTQLPCDSLIESCFVFAEPECETPSCESYYKVIYAPAYALRECRPDNGECITQECAQSDVCTVVTCSEASREEMEIVDVCSQGENPI